MIDCGAAAHVSEICYVTLGGNRDTAAIFSYIDRCKTHLLPTDRKQNKVSHTPAPHTHTLAPRSDIMSSLAQWKHLPT